MAITQVSNSLVKQDLTISGGTVDNTVIGSGTPAAGTFTTIGGTLASSVVGTTQSAGDNSTKIATTAYVTTALANLVDSAPSTLDTLNELAAALGDDPNFATTVTNNIAAKAPLANPTFTTGIDVTGSVTADGLTSSGPIILTAGALAAAGNAGLSHRSSDNKVYLQAGTGGFNILDDQQNTHFFIDSAGASTFSGAVTANRFINSTGSADPWLKGVNASGTETSFIKKSGEAFFSSNVGIGTSSVNANLEIRGSSSNGQVRLGGSTSGVYGKLYSDNDGVFIVSADAGNAAANSYFGVEVDGGEAMRIDSSGSVGIGTTNIVSPLTTSIGAGAAGSLNNQISMTHSGASNHYHIKTIRASANDEPTGLAFVENTTERMRISDDGKLIHQGKSGTSPIFEMINNDNEDTDTGRETTLRFSGHRSGGEDVVNAQISGHHDGSADDDKGQLKFWTNTGSGGLTEKVQIESAGDVRIKAGNLVVETAGAGIYLGGTAAANKLDDYEEGTWTPSLIAGTTNPTGGSNLAPSGTYTKIGNRVWLTFYIGRSWTNSPSGTVYIGNFPFTVHSTSPNYYSANAVTYNVDFGTANIPFLIPTGGSNSAALYTAANSGTWSALTWQSNMTSSSGTYVSGTIHFVVA